VQRDKQIIVRGATHLKDECLVAAQDVKKYCLDVHSVVRNHIVSYNNWPKKQ
jgi:hypothetical protein